MNEVVFKDYFGNDITRDVVAKLEDVFPDFINFRVKLMGRCYK